MWVNHGALQDFCVSKPNYPPPKFLKCDRTNQVFVTLLWDVMRCPVHFNHNLVLDKRKVHYSMQTEEWVLGAVRYPKETYLAFQGDLRKSLVTVKSSPVS